jgi:hypothetical protein
MDTIKQSAPGTCTLPDSNEYRVDVCNRSTPVVRMGPDDEGRHNFSVNGRIVYEKTN